MNPGREMDTLVATKVMGWTNQLAFRKSCLDGTIETCYVPMPPKLTVSLEPGTIGLAPEVPHYSTDIAAAWEVVEKFEVVEITKGAEIVGCRIRVGKGHGTYEAGHNWVTSSDASVPFVICLAALDVVGAL